MYQLLAEYNLLLLPFADIDDCLPNPCQHGGNCTDEINDYNCTCAAGYTGKDCEIGNYLLVMLSPRNQCRIHHLMPCSF